MANNGHFEFAPGRIGKSDGVAGVQVRERRAGLLASVVARRGAAATLATVAERAFGVTLPRTPRFSCTSDTANPVSFVWSGSGQWLVECAIAGDTFDRLQTVLAGTASVFDQSDSRVLLDVRGARIRDALAKGLQIDLHPSSFSAGDVAITTASHVGVQIWQCSLDPMYRLAVPRSYFGSFWHWLSMSAAEYGCEIMRPV